MNTPSDSSDPWQAVEVDHSEVLNETFVNDVVHKVQRQHTFRDLLLLVLVGFGSIMLGFLVGRTSERDQKEHELP